MFACMIYLAQACLSSNRAKKSQNWAGGRKIFARCFAKPNVCSLLQGFRTKPAGDSAVMLSTAIAWALIERISARRSVKLH